MIEVSSHMASKDDAKLGIPRLEDYGISPKTGFVPETLPILKLPQDYYGPWENLAQNLPSLILNRTLRSIVDEKLEVLDCKFLETDAQWQRAYSILCFLTHAYVWSYNDEPRQELPPQLSKPLLQTSEYLDLPPVATYAGLVLWNFKPAILLNSEKSPERTIDLERDNFSTITTFTGSVDESWFYLVSCHFEIAGARCLDVGLKALQAATENKPDLVVQNLQELAQSIDALGTLLMSMEKMCDPHVFYFRIRPFLAGWKNMAEYGFTGGLIYNDGTEKHKKEYAGGSNAQSSLIQYFDVLLGVKHWPTGFRPHSKGNDKNSTLISESSDINNKETNFMESMKFYMPKQHREFLDHLEHTSVLKKYVELNGKDIPELLLSYDACLAMLKSFRDKHIQIVTRYIIIPSRSQNSSKTIRTGLASKSVAEISENASKGTGGTALLPFLKQCRDETGDPAAGSWGRRILSSGLLSLKYTKPAGKSEKDSVGHW